jgi:hypothetical protein
MLKIIMPEAYPFHFADTDAIGRLICTGRKHLGHGGIDMVGEPSILRRRFGQKKMWYGI